MTYSIIQYPALPSVYTKANGRRIDMIVLHATAGNKASDLYTLTGRDQTHLVSIHYYITKVGEIYQIVQDKEIAWHAGVSYWEGEGDCNKFSLGIELENANSGSDPYPQAQQDALMWLCATKVQQYNIPQSRFVRHVDISPGRKTDPRGFPWESFKNALYQSIQAPPPPPPPPPLPDPSPDQKLRDLLIDMSYRRVRHVYHPDWAMHQYAIKQRLGPPLGPAFKFSVGRQSYVGEMYGLDAIYSNTSEWQNITKLSDMDESDVKKAFRSAAYAQLGVEYHDDWAQHQYANTHKIGVPVTENVRLTLSDGRIFGTQIFALDTLYSPDGMWGEVDTLSALLANNALSPADQMLRDTLLNQAYERVGNRYRPDWAMQQFGLANGLGAPITDQAPLDIGKQEYMVMSYARSVVYTPVGDWSIVRTLNDLLDKNL